MLKGEYVMTNYRPEMNPPRPKYMHGLGAMMDMDKYDLDKMSIMQKDDDLEGMSLAMAYVPWQRWKNVYDLNRALKIGTIFPELDMPFMGMRGDKI